MAVDLTELLQGCEHVAKQPLDWLVAFRKAWIVETSAPRHFVFRGQKNAVWPMESSLARATAPAAAVNGALPSGSFDRERAMRELEDQIMVDTYKRGLAFWEGSRQSYLLQLAYLQHYGAPTRLIDVTSDANIALWFACEDDSVDGRLFVFSIGGTRSAMERELTSSKAGRTWVDRYKCPWSQLPETVWQRESYFWRPAHFDRRMFAQQGGFLFGGYPTAGAQVRRWNQRQKATQTTKGVRDTSSVHVDWAPANPAQWKGRGKVPNHLAMTISIPKAAKAEIRQTLARMYGITHRRLFPDFMGVADVVRNHALNTLG